MSSAPYVVTLRKMRTQPLLAKMIHASAVFSAVAICLAALVTKGRSEPMPVPWSYEIVSATPPDTPAVIDLSDSPILTAAAAPLFEALEAVSQQSTLPDGFVVQIRFLDVEGFGQEQRISWPDLSTPLVTMPDPPGPNMIVDLSVSRMLGDIEAAEGDRAFRGEPLWAPDPRCVSKMLSEFQELVRRSTGPLSNDQMLEATTCLPAGYRDRYAHVLAAMPRSFRGGLRQAFGDQILACFEAVHDARRGLFERILFNFVENSDRPVQNADTWSLIYLDEIHSSDAVQSTCFRDS